MTPPDMYPIFPSRRNKSSDNISIFEGEPPVSERANASESASAEADASTTFHGLLPSVLPHVGPREYTSQRMNLLLGIPAKAGVHAKAAPPTK